MIFVKLLLSVLCYRCQLSKYGLSHLCSVWVNDQMGTATHSPGFYFLPLSLQCVVFSLKIRFLMINNPHYYILYGYAF